MRNVLRAAAYLTRGLIADVLVGVGEYVRPPEERPEWMSRVISESRAETRFAKPGDVLLSDKARRMLDEIVEETRPAEDEHAPTKPLRGSLAWRMKHGDSR